MDDQRENTMKDEFEKINTKLNNLSSDFKKLNLNKTEEYILNSLSRIESEIEEMKIDMKMLKTIVVRHEDDIQHLKSRSN